MASNGTDTGHCWWQCKVSQTLWKTLGQFLINIHIPYALAISLLCIYLRETTMFFSRKNLCMNMCNNFIHNCPPLEMQIWNYFLLLVDNMCNELFHVLSQPKPSTFQARWDASFVSFWKAWCLSIVHFNELKLFTFGNIHQRKPIYLMSVLFSMCIREKAFEKKTLNNQ